MLKMYRSLRKSGVVVAIAFAAFQTSTIPTAMAQMQPRCLTQAITMCQFRWESWGYADYPSCIEDVADSACPPEEGGGTFVCWIDTNGFPICAWGE